MGELELGAVEARFANLIWQNEPVSSTELVKIAVRELSWKKSTIYTALKRLGQRGIFQNQNGTVSALLSREEFYAAQSEQFVEEPFAGSLPVFLSAFITRKKLSEDEFEQLQQLIGQIRR